MWGVKTARALASIRKSAHRVTTIMYIRGPPGALMSHVAPTPPRVDRDAGAAARVFATTHGPNRLEEFRVTLHTLPAPPSRCPDLTADRPNFIY